VVDPSYITDRIEPPAAQVVQVISRRQQFLASGPADFIVKFYDGHGAGFTQKSPHASQHLRLCPLDIDLHQMKPGPGGEIVVQRYRRHFELGISPYPLHIMSDDIPFVRTMLPPRKQPYSITRTIGNGEVFNPHLVATAVCSNIFPQQLDILGMCFKSDHETGRTDQFCKQFGNDSNMRAYIGTGPPRLHQSLNGAAHVQFIGGALVQPPLNAPSRSGLLQLILERRGKNAPKYSYSPT